VSRQTSRHSLLFTPNSILHVRDWPSASRFFVIILAVIALNVLTWWSASQLGLSLVSWGWANLAIISGLVAWYFIDALFPRRAIYEVWGDTEGPLRLELRLWRKMILLTCVVIGLAGAGITLYPLDELTRQSTAPVKIPPEALRPLFVLVGAYLAAIGWLYTTFEKEKSDRASNTLMAIRDQLYGNHVSTVHLQLQLLTKDIQAKMHLGHMDPIPSDKMARKVSDLPDDIRPDGRISLTLTEVLDQFLNALNQLALGVRLGQFDLRTVQLVLRPRFIRYAFVYSEYIREQTKAEQESTEGRWRSKVRTWEHFLWLVSRLDVLETDQVDINKIVLPPKNLPRAKPAKPGPEIGAGSETGDPNPT